MAQTNPTQLATAALEEPPPTRVAMHAPITRGERIADSAAALVGSWRFIIVQRLQLAVAHETRDAAIIELLLQTGMRLSELARFTRDDIDLPQKISREDGHVGSVDVVGKGRKDRTITLNWKVCRTVRVYLAVRRDIDGDRLFITKFGQGVIYP